MRAPLIPVGLLLILATAVASPMAAVNLVTNPSFAGSTNGWVVNPSSTTYDSFIDAIGAPGSGSARSAFVAAGPGTYTLGGKVLIPNGQAVGGSGDITVSTFSGGDCLTGFLTFSRLTTSTTGSFQTLSGPVTAPAGTAHIWITGQNAASGAARTSSTSTISCSTTARPRPFLPSLRSGWRRCV